MMTENLETNNFFTTARPVWFQGLEKEKNLHAGFRTVFQCLEKTSVMLRLTGSTIYRVFLNGEFIQHGPARGPHGFYRVDELDLSNRLVEGANLLAIEVVGYNCNSFAYLNQPSFVQAELTIAREVVAATGEGGFDALRLTERIQKVERYSFQRPFMEAYTLAPGFDDWRNHIDAEFEVIPCAIQSEKKLIPRGVALSDFAVFSAERVGGGEIAYAERTADCTGFWWMNTLRREQVESFMPEAFERDILQIYQSCSVSNQTGEGRYTLYDLGTNLTGFIQLEISCRESARLMAVFDEVLVENDIDLSRNATLNLAYFELQPGTYRLESIEPYTFRFLKIIALDGLVEVHKVGLREYANAEASRSGFHCSDPELNRLFEAGRQTFRQNATDIYMDCPGRERAGWLCDSFFTGRVEPLLCGGSKVEHNFIENFLLPDRFEHLPVGMLPMCYPSEHPDGTFIPQWAMWLVLELEEYLARTGDRSLVERMHPKISSLLDYFKRFENSDGLLEKLPGWNFIEWSKANELTQDVNYPTNMLYARMLESAARLYGKNDLLERARQIHQAVRQQSFNGTYFVDNALRDESGLLKPSGECTEVCQYYAFFCGTASPEKFSTLWKILLSDFGPKRAPDGPHAAVYPANAFIGYYLRMELLSLHGENVRLLKEMKGYFLSMAQTTGTLWEHCDVRASCNHGFASHLCVHLYRDVLGVRSIDPVAKTVEIAIPQSLPLTACSGSIPVADGRIEVRWSGEKGDPAPYLNVPPGWTVHKP